MKRFELRTEENIPESEDELFLSNQVWSLGGVYFSDMLFMNGSRTYEYTLVNVQTKDGSWHKHGNALPEVLEFFNYDWFKFTVDFYDTAGYFNTEDQVLNIDPDCLDDEDVILHEMIHLHECVLYSLPTYYSETVLFSLYWDLKKKIPDLDQIIQDQMHIYRKDLIYFEGGEHDTLFMLKSFDIDLMKGYQLGTIMGYGDKTFLIPDDQM